MQQAVPQTNHVNNVSQSSTQSETAHRPEREEPQDDGIRLAHGEEVRYALELQGRPRQPTAEVDVETVSPDPIPGPSHKNGQQTVVQVALPPEQNGNVVYKRGLVPRTDTEKQVQRKTALAQVEHWVLVQKEDPPKRSVRAVMSSF